MNIGSGGRGAYASGTIRFNTSTKLFLFIGGKGEDQTGIAKSDFGKGGYNGGGDGFRHIEGCGGGGGATDFRINEDDFWHRILVAGGGGGSDNVVAATEYKNADDGSGGAGGGKEAQGFWIDGNYNGSKIATQISGFTFGNGESSQQNGSLGDGFKQGLGYSDRPGAGGGWFGGFAGHHGNGGSGGGSSFAFTSGIDYPKELIEAKNENGTLIEKSYYLFRDQPEYYLTSVTFSTGIWSGNGHAKITLLIPLTQYQCTNYRFPFPDQIP